MKKKNAALGDAAHLRGETGRGQRLSVSARQNSTNTRARQAPRVKHTIDAGRAALHRGYVDSNDRDIQNAYGTLCRLNRQPFVRVRQRGKTATIYLEMQTVTDTEWNALPKVQEPFEHALNQYAFVDANAQRVSSGYQFFAFEGVPPQQAQAFAARVFDIASDWQRAARSFYELAEIKPQSR